MQYGKMDAALSSVLARAEAERLPVFVRFAQPLTQECVQRLSRCGIPANVGERVVTARVPVQVIGDLSEFSWVRSIALSGRLRPLGS